MHSAIPTFTHSSPKKEFTLFTSLAFLLRWCFAIYFMVTGFLIWGSFFPWSA